MAEVEEFPVEALLVPQYDMSDPGQVQQRNNAMMLRRQEDEEHLRSVLATYPGRAFVWSILASTNVEQGTFCGEQPMTMSRAEGRREVGRELLYDRVLTIAPRAYTMMRREAAEREQRYARLVGLAQYDEQED